MPRRTTASAEPPADETPDGAASASTTTEVVSGPEPTAGPGPDGTGTQAPTAPGAEPGESGFFTWLRRLDVPRRAGWLGGVCAGVAERIGIDPLIVRGIVVVLAVVGAPIALVYAAAWFLLPDENGTIHAQELGHGRVTRALPGIVAVFLLSFLPLTQGFWYTGALYWSNLDWAGGVGRAVWTGVVLVVVIVLVVWLARRSQTEVQATPATTDDRPETVPAFPADADAAAAAAAGVVAASVVVTPASPVADPGEPPAPPADASAEELAAWKRSQDEWQQQRAVWAAEQKRGERERRQAEASAQALAAMEASRERARIRKLTRPRASAGVVFLVLGLGLLAAALTAFAASKSPETTGAEWMIGAAALVLTLGAGTVIVGLARRRSGALAFFSILSVLALAVAVVLPTDRQAIPLGASWGISTVESGRYWQLAGYTSMYVQDRDAAEPPVIDLWQYTGSLNVDLAEGATLRVVFETDAADTSIWIQEQSLNGMRTSTYRVTDGRLEFLVGSGTPDLVLHVWGGPQLSMWVNPQHDGSVYMALTPAPHTIDEWNDDGDHVSIDPNDAQPEPSPIPTEGATP